MPKKTKAKNPPRSSQSKRKTKPKAKPKKTASDKHGSLSEKQYQKLVANLRPLVEELKQMQKTAKVLGLFADDRELLDCPKCGLMEDVNPDGYLITYQSGCRLRIDDPNIDTGLRFTQIDKKKFQCPQCGFRVVNRDGLMVLEPPRPSQK